MNWLSTKFKCRILWVLIYIFGIFVLVALLPRGYDPDPGSDSLIHSGRVTADFPWQVREGDNLFISYIRFEGKSDWVISWDSPRNVFYTILEFTYSLNGPGISRHEKGILHLPSLRYEMKEERGTLTKEVLEEWLTPGGGYSEEIEVVMSYIEKAGRGELPEPKGRHFHYDIEQFPMGYLAHRKVGRLSPRWFWVGCLSWTLIVLCIGLVAYRRKLFTASDSTAPVKAGS